MERKKQISWTKVQKSSQPPSRRTQRGNDRPFASISKMPRCQKFHGIFGPSCYLTLCLYNGQAGSSRPPKTWMVKYQTFMTEFCNKSMMVHQRFVVLNLETKLSTVTSLITMHAVCRTRVMQKFRSLMGFLRFLSGIVQNVSIH